MCLIRYIERLLDAHGDLIIGIALVAMMTGIAVLAWAAIPLSK
jgi:hypothetical protein